MQKLIDAIKFDGQKKFNMSAFIGKLNDEQRLGLAEIIPDCITHNDKG